MQHQLAMRDGVGQLLLQLQAGLQAEVELGVEEAVARPAQGLGLVHRNIGVLDQGFKVLRVFGE